MMGLLGYVLTVAVTLFFIVKLSYHLFYEIPHDREIVDRRSGDE